MKLKLYILLFLSLFCLISLQAQDYLINFAGSGASTTVVTVKVENLTQGTELAMNGSVILHLKNVITGIDSYIEDSNQRISFSPNPMTDYSLIRFDLPEEGQTTTSLYDITGGVILQIQDYLNKGQQTYRIQGIKNGFYIAKVVSNRNLVSGRLLCSGSHLNDPKIIYENAGAALEKENNSKGISSETVMQYNAGDRLKLTGISDIYSTIITDVPSESKTITFYFIPCTDGDGNNYPVVQIGTQTWMAENLAWLPSVSPRTIGSAIDEYYYVYGYNGTNVATAKTQANYITYGVLYNWTAAMDSTASSSSNPSGVQGACPTGWHMPSNAEWTVLSDYLINNGYGYEGSGDDIAKSMAYQSYWETSTTPGTPGNLPAGNNSSGFAGLPAGDRTNGQIFSGLNLGGEWWSSTENTASIAYYYGLYSNNVRFPRLVSSKLWGYSVRCVKD